MKRIATFTAMNRFGLGPAPEEAARVDEDPRSWVHEQIAFQDMPRAFSRFESSAEIIKTIHQARLTGPDELRQATRKAYRSSFAPEVIARARVMIETDTPFAERMVLFWSNHFTVSRSKAIVGPAIPAYEREAIRPHVFGNFADMLQAVCCHPAMLSYLDNMVSMGEKSRAGRRRKARTGTEKALNENLAREILELHTLGVNGGYTQSDVVEFAKAITGWSHGGMRLKFESQPVHGQFEFKAAFHEPGNKTIMGETYQERGEVEGREILDDLARHPSTANFVATKLVRHFVADQPSADSVEEIAAVFRDTGGDLAEVSHALVELDEAWSNPLSKVKSHYEYVISVNRALNNRNAGPRDLLQPLREMGQMPFSAPSPAGWGDRAKDWIAPEALMRRIEWVHSVATRLLADYVPAEALDGLIGPVASDDVRLEVERAPSGREALSLILASSEFQRR